MPERIPFSSWFGERKKFQEAVEVEEVSEFLERTRALMPRKLVWQHGLSGDRDLTEMRDYDRKSFSISLDNLSTSAIQKSGLLS